MTTVKRITDLVGYTGVLPYASEMFGVYQPLLGWKSKRIERRFRDGQRRDRVQLLEKLEREFSGVVDVRYLENGAVAFELEPGILSGAKVRSFGSVVLSRISSKLPQLEQLVPSVWQQLITPESLQALLKTEVAGSYSESYAETLSAGLEAAEVVARSRSSPTTSALDRKNALTVTFERQLEHESAVAGTLLHLVKEKNHAALTSIFYATKARVDDARRIIRRIEGEDGMQGLLGIDTLEPGDRDQMQSVVLSPIAVVHLFRQYFFELDTFLGTPVSHVWLSPGSSVELLEIHTRRSVVEKTLENTLETMVRSESSTTVRDEIAEAVKDDQRQDIKFGAGVKASYASIEATSNFDYARSQQTARETTHKQMREQTQKLSSEIRKNFKSTFKSITELADVSSVKHTLANTSTELINYELRRKMRQVGVQVQDIGTFLCWQTYVDDPGRQLGIAELVHVAKPAALDGLPHPEEIPLLVPFQEERTITVPFISVDNTNADSEGEVYVDGVEADDSESFGYEERIQSDFAQEFVCPKANFELTNVEFDPQRRPVKVSRRGPLTTTGEKATFVLHLDSADFQGQNSLSLRVILHWTPRGGANDEIAAKNRENLASFKERERAEYEKAYVETVKDRVTLLSKIRTRQTEELREEERIVVYRKLVQDLLLNDVDLPDDRSRHVAAELLNSIFDIDKMLYFVAPEWWRPRLHIGRQQLQETSRPKVDRTVVASAAMSVLERGLMRRLHASSVNVAPSVVSSSKVGWGGVNDADRDNYLITEDSEPARLGSSLGWLLQLDGDNLRNAFLNAPWVKAVVPIRPGKEKAALNWLKGVEGMNGITDDVLYRTDNPNEADVNGHPLDGQKLIDVLSDLGEKVHRKYQEGVAVGRYPKASEVSDPALVDNDNTVTATPIDRVYEHGFFPLEGSFRANVGANYEIFDQWIEILPTDQIVPVEVKYDPKTGRQV